MLELEEPIGAPSLTTPDRRNNSARRLYERRTDGTCVTQVGDDMYPVENWSQSGLLLGGEGKYLGMHQVYDTVLRFKLSDRVLNIQHQARVVRKAGNKTALQFLPLTQEIRHGFQQVIDDIVAGGFANSQA